jgi:hypothetical protein
MDAMCSKDHFNYAVFAGAVGIFGVCLIKNSLHELTNLLKRVELDKEIAAELYKISLL